MDIQYALPHRRRPKVALSLVEALVALCIVSILASLSLAAIQMARRSADQAERLNWRRQRILDDPPPRGIPFRILFVGNSHTSNGGIDIPSMVQELSRLAKRAEVWPTRVVVGGMTIKGHWDAGQAAALIPERDGDWFDFVVLQGQSQEPCLGRAEYLDYTLRLAAQCKETLAIPLVYQLFEREDGSCRQDRLTRASVEAVKRIQGNDGVGELCPIGEAWQAARSLRPTLVMHQADGNHANETGAYLTACVFYAVLHRESPVGLPHVLETTAGVIAVDAEVAGFLQAVAWKTSQRWRLRTQPWFMTGKAA